MADISGLNSVTVDKWGTKENGNDCYWNIAKNQSGSDATTEEIANLTQQIQEYNVEYNDDVQTKEDTIYEGEEILLPLDCSIDEISSGVETATSDVSDATSKVETATSELASAEAECTSAAEYLAEVQSEYDAASADADNRPDLAGIKGKLDNAKQAAADALNAKNEAQTKLDNEKTNLEDKKTKLEELKTELEELKTEYSDKKDQYEEELAQIDTLISDCSEKIDDAEQKLEAAKQEQENAQAYDTVAEQAGFEKDENGDYQVPEDGSASIKDVVVSMVDGKLTKSIIYTDGTIVKIDENGNTTTDKSACKNTDKSEPTEDEIRQYVANNNGGVDKNDDNSKYDVNNDGRIDNFDIAYKHGNKENSNDTKAADSTPDEAVPNNQNKENVNNKPKEDDNNSNGEQEDPQIIKDIDRITNYEQGDENQLTDMQNFAEQYDSKEEAKAEVDEAFENAQGGKINGHTKEEYYNVIDQAYSQVQQQ